MSIPFKRFGVMVDMSRNAVMKPEAVKEFATEIAKMGYNTLMLYTEDVYEIPTEPFFGHFRGRYSCEDIRAIVAHCKKLNMEVIPCIQTLAHLEGIFKSKHYLPLRDTANILLADDEKVDELIRKMLRTVKDCYDTDQIHIGMDEAHLLGLGKYLDRHGYQNRFEILSRHLHKVVKMAKEEGLVPNIWSDMFFRLGNGGVYSSDHPKIDPDQIGELPEGLALTYWDYYSTVKRRYRAMFRAHKRLTDDIWFAGGIWTWKGFAPDNRYSISTCLPGLSVAAEEGVENAFVTLWGDDGGECSRFAVLPALFTVAKFAQGQTDQRVIQKEFEAEYGISFRRFLALDMKIEKEKVSNPEKYLLLQDPFLGVLDSTLRGNETAFYKNAAKKLSSLAKNERFGYLFASQAALARTLSHKAELGAKTRRLYQEGDREGMKKLLAEYRLTRRELKKFISLFRARWLRENRPQGLEVQEARLGGLALRLASCEERLSLWIEKGEPIPELAEPCLDYWGDEEFRIGHVRAAHYVNYFSSGREA